MVLEVKKHERENSQNLIRRFTKKVQLSGILIEARKGRFFKRVKSPNMRKAMALRKQELKAEYQKLKKLGQLKIKKR
jgi:ribosomal protein S21